MMRKSFRFYAGALATTALLSACSKGTGQAADAAEGSRPPSSMMAKVLNAGPPSDFLEACVATVPRWIFADSEGYRVRDFVEVLSGSLDAEVSWEKAGAGYILRQRVSDQLSGQMFERVIQMDRLPLATDNVNCGPGAVLMRRVVENGVELDDQSRGQMAMAMAKHTPWEGRRERQEAHLRNKQAR